MENHPQNIIGTEVVVLNGTWKGIHGVIIAIEGDELTIETKIFGRFTPVSVKEADLDYISPNVYVLHQIEKEIKADALYGLQKEMDEWWIKKVLEGSCPNWAEYLNYKDGFWTKLNVVTEQLLVQFKLDYPNANSAGDLVERYLGHGSISNLKGRLIKDNAQWLPNYYKIHQSLYGKPFTEKEFTDRQDLLQKATERKRESYVYWWNTQLQKTLLSKADQENYAAQLSYNYEKESFSAYESRANPLKQKLLHEIHSVDAIEFLLKDYSSETEIDYFGMIENAPADCVWKQLEGMGVFEKICTIFEPLDDDEKFLRIFENFCLAVLTLKTAGNWYLVYLFDNYDDLSAQASTFEYRFDFHIGAAPTTSPKLTRANNWIIPDDLRQFYTIHNGFGDFNGGKQVFWANNIASDSSVSDMQFMVEIAEQQDFEPEDYEFENLLKFYSDGSGNGYFFHRDSPEDANPDVRYWDHETREIGERQSFMEFLNYDFFAEWQDY